MSRDDIIRMAREAGLDPDLWNYTDAFERYAYLVANHEREGCVKVVEELLDEVIGHFDKESAEKKMVKNITCHFKEGIVNVIRARGEK